MDRRGTFHECQGHGPLLRLIRYVVYARGPARQRTRDASAQIAEIAWDPWSTIDAIEFGLEPTSGGVCELGMM